MFYIKYTRGAIREITVVPPLGEGTGKYIRFDGRGAQKEDADVADIE